MATVHSSAEMTVSGLRTRYVPRSRVGQAFFSMAPWLDLVLLLFFFLLIRDDLVIQPGIVVDLPRAELQGGAHLQLAAVVLALETRVPGVHDELVVFEDQSYRMDNAAQLNALRGALGTEVATHGATSLLLAADARVRHGTLVTLYTLARETGLKEVNLAARPSAGGDRE